MGMFDRIYLKKKCPYCGEVSEMEFQTKDGECFLNSYKKGDVFDNGQFRKIDAIGDCRSFTCQLESAKESVWTCGYYGGFSRSFDVYIYCDSKGRITDKMKIYKLGDHKGVMKGKLGELKGKEDNMKVVRYIEFKKDKIIPAKMVKMTTDGWLDKFRKGDTFDNQKEVYENILYLFNLEDNEEAFRLWFLFRHDLRTIIELLRKKLKLREDEEFASVFLSNAPWDILELTQSKHLTNKEVKK